MEYILYNTAGTTSGKADKIGKHDDFPNVINTTSVYDSRDSMAFDIEAIFMYSNEQPTPE